MVLPFKHVSHRLYKNTFLQNVLVSFNFSDSGWSSHELNTGLSSFILSSFGLAIKDDFPRTPMSICSSDKMICFLFGLDVASVRIGARNYQSFEDSVIPQVLKLSKYLSIIKVSTVSKLMVRKVNIWPISVDDESKLNVEMIEKGVFSSEFLSTEDTPNKEMVNSITLRKKCVWNDGNAQIIVARTAFIPIQEDKTKANLILDIEASFDCDTDIDAAKAQINLLNNTLFDVYHWCVNKDIISLMENQ